MKKSLFLSSLLAICLPFAASAQEVAPQVEIFGGYSFLRADTGDTTLDDIHGHGFNTSLAGNINKHIGIVGEFSRFTISETFTTPVTGTVTLDSNVLTYLFGPRITLRRGKVEPFVHALLGGARENDKISGGLVGEVTDSGFAFALGGGLDVKVHDNFAIRVAQVDYLGDKLGEQTGNNFRFSVGIVIRLGKQ
jgi:opacity protein-like surface antigen